MIRFIAVIDQNRGMADDRGIPWQGKLPTDIAFFRAKTRHSTVLMGYNTYQEFAAPLSDRENYVASARQKNLREGFKLVRDAREFLENNRKDVWVIGGAGLFASTLDLADELYITQLEAKFPCTKFFPEFKSKFELIKSEKPLTESGITFRFEIYGRRSV